MDYAYPLDYRWSTEEILKVISLYNAVEQAYETGIKSADFLVAYKNFKQVVLDKSTEKQLDKQFLKVSGYSIYRAFQAAKENEWVKLS